MVSITWWHPHSSYATNLTLTIWLKLTKCQVSHDAGSDTHTPPPNLKIRFGAPQVALPGGAVAYTNKGYLGWLQRVSKVETRLRIPDYLKARTDNSEHYSWQFTRDNVVCCVCCLWCTHVIYSLHQLHRRRLLKFVLYI